MIGEHSESNTRDSINIAELYFALWQSKLLILIITVIISLIVLLYTLSLPNIYKAEAVLSPVEAENELNQTLQNFGGLARLAGINIGGNTSGSLSAKAIEKIQSLSFFSEKLIPNIYLPDLMAIDSWNAKTNMVSYDDSLFDSKSGKWVREVNFPKTVIPSPQESFKVFYQSFSISQDKDSGFVRLAYEHQSPYIAKLWLELMIKEINLLLREEKKIEAEKSFEYLKNQMEINSFANVDQVFAGIMQNEIQKLTLIESREFYVFQYIDPPAVAQFKSKPRRALICIFGAVFGGIFGVLLVLARHLILHSRKG